MFSFFWRPKPPTCNIEAIQRTSEMLFFDPPAIVRAIHFHLLDEGRARAVTSESSEAVVRQLAQRIRCLTISASHWAAMNNVQRLEWLLKESHIVVTSTSSRPARLSVRRWPTLVTSELLWGRQ